MVEVVVDEIEDNVLVEPAQPSGLQQHRRVPLSTLASHVLVVGEAGR